MACIGNMPSFQYVTVEGLVITYKEIPYPIKAFTTNKKYIVWNIDRPYQLEDTNVRPESSLLEYLIVINDKGKPTVVEYEELLYAFDQNINGSNLLTSTEYNNLKTEVKDTTKKFNLMSNTVEGMSQIIGTTEDLDDGTIIYNLNKVKSDSESHGISISEIQTKIDDKYKEIKPIILNDLVEYLRSVSEYKLSFTIILEDTLITQEELSLINTNKTNMKDKLAKLQLILNEFKDIIDSIQDVEKSNLVTEMKNKLDTIQNALISMCDSYLQDNKISGEEKTNIIQKVYELTTYIGTVQNTCNNITVNGQAGVIYSIENELLMLKDKTTSSIKELSRETDSLVETVETQSSEISQMKDSITTKVEKTEVNTAIDDKLKDYSNTTQTSSMINQKAGSILSTVEEIYLNKNDANLTYATQGSLTQTSKNIIASFRESGGYNLLRQNLEQWNTWSATSLGFISDGTVRNQTSSKKSLKVGNNTWNEQYVASPRMRIQPNKAYTISGKYYVGSDCYGTDVYWFESDTIDSEGYPLDVSFDRYIALASDSNYSNGLWKSFAMTIVTSSNAKSALLRLDNNGSKNEMENFTYFSDLMIVEGEVQREWCPHPYEVSDGIIELDRDGIVVEMIEGEGSKGYSKISYEGIATYDAEGTAKSWFSDDNAYIKELTVDNIKNPNLIQSKPRFTNWYVGQSSMGNGTGQDYYNKANSINSVLEYIKNNYGAYMNQQDIVINCDDWMNLYEKIYIGGWIGSGDIIINFGANSSFTGAITIEDCTSNVTLNGQNSGWGVNDGCMWYRSQPNNQGEALTVKNTNVICKGFRTHNNSSAYKYPFVFASYGSKVILDRLDLVKYWSICHCYIGATVYVGLCRGDVGVLCEKSDNSSIIARNSLPIFNEGKDIRSNWNSLYNIDGSDGTNSLWYPKDISGGSSTPEYTPPSQSWHWVEKTFYFNLSSTTEGGGNATSNWTDKWGQGKWGNYKSHRGHAVPTENISNWLGGAYRNVSMTLKMTRLNTNHGQYGAIPVPKIKQKDGSYWNSGVAFALGNTKTIQLAGSISDGLADGSLSELTMWAGANTSEYSQYNNVSLTITCEKYY